MAGMKDGIVVVFRLTTGEAGQLTSAACARSLTPGGLVRLAMCQEYGICRNRTRPTCGLCGRTADVAVPGRQTDHG